MEIITTKKPIQLMGHLHSANDLVQHLIQMGHPPQNIVWTGYGIFFTVKCEKDDKKDVERFVNDF